MNNRRRQSLRSASGFTLVEMLVAMAVFILIMTIFLNIVNGASGTWRRGEGQNQRRSSGRALLQYISRELQQTALPVNMSTSAAANPADLQFVVFSNGMSSAGATSIDSQYINPNAIFWQAPIAHDTSAGELAAVGYFVKWGTTDGRPSTQLCRYYAEQSATNTDFQVYQSDGGGGAQNWLGNIDTIAPAAPNNPQGWFADNVFAIWVLCLDQYGQPITQSAAGRSLNHGFDSRQGYTDSQNIIHPAPALPAAVEIAVGTLDETTAGRLTSAQAAALQSQVGTTDITTETLFSANIANFVSNMTASLASVKAGTQVFSTTVYFPNSHP